VDYEAGGCVKSPAEIITEAMTHKPVAIRVGFSGGRDSLAITHWMMANVPGCEVFHCNTGIGIERTRQFVRDTCKAMGWPLHEIRAKEDCGQDYDEIVKKHGFPGSYAHKMMFTLLKERPIRELVRRLQTKRGQRVMIAAGVRHDESVRRMGYAGAEVTRNGSLVWASPIYWWSASDRDAYIRAHNLPVNPISQMLGMSGECLCGAFAHKGEKSLVRIVDPGTAARIDALEQEVSALGFNWGWEGKPPKGGRNKAQLSFHPFCMGCEKAHFEEVA
jgi:3'-phosphoadenosine 5'-phosphosulfate sulfotransferase (PAPS reductase)/FAD synthetase